MNTEKRNTVLRLCAVFLLSLGLSRTGFAEEVQEQKPVSAEETPGALPESQVDSAGAADESSGAKAAPNPGESGVKGDTAQENPDISPLIKTARRNFEKGQFQAAQKAASLALDIAPRDYEAVKLRGMASYKLGSLATAREDFEMARTARVKDAEFDLFSGALYARAGDFGAAEKEFEKGKDYSSFNRSARLIKKCLPYVRWKSLRQRAAAAVGEKGGESSELDPLTVAVISTGAGEGDTAVLGKGLAEALTLHLSAVKRLHAVGREEVQAYGEVWTQKGGKLSGKEGMRVFGRMLKAGNLVSFTVGGDSAGWSLSGAVTDAVTGQASEIAAVKAAPDSLLSLERDFAGVILKVLDLPPTPDEVEKLRRPYAHNFNAFQSFSAGVDAEDRGDFPAAEEEYRNAMNQDSWFKRAAAAHRRAERLAECAAVEDLTTVAPLGLFEALMD